MGRTPRVRRRDVLLHVNRSSEVSDRLPYACYFLCDACGWLEDRPTGGDPMRSDREQLEPGPCPSCQSRRWVDLGNQSLALSYRESEAFGNELHAQRSRRRGLLMGGLMMVALLFGCLGAFESIERPGLLVGLVLAFGAWQAWAIAGLAYEQRPGRARPRRWRRPLPRPELATAVKDPVEASIEGDAVLRAPLGGEPCVAWSVQVWSGDELLLDEGHQAPLSVGGVQLPADAVTLELRRRSRPLPAGDDEPLVRFMGRRGLSIHDASLRILEARLVPGESVTLRPAARRGRPTGLVLSQAPALAS